MKKIEMQNKGNGKFIFMCIVIFMIVFILSAVFKFVYKPGALREYVVNWTSDIGFIRKDLAYGNGEYNKFDLYLPADSTKQLYGLVVYLHPGGFATGDKSEDSEMLKWLCSKGYVAAGINYTLRNEKNPESNVYSQSLEIKRSISAVVEEAKKLGYNLDAMAISGGSAGGTLAMLYAYRDADQSPVPVKMVFQAVGPPSFYPEDWGVYGLDKNPEAAAGLFSVMSGSKISKDMLGTEAYEGAIKPISAYKWIDKNSVPIVCAYGMYDKICPFASVKHLVKALQDYGVKHEYIEFPHSGHGLQNDTKLYIRYMQKVEEYLNIYLPVKRSVNREKT